LPKSGNDVARKRAGSNFASTEVGSIATWLRRSEYADEIIEGDTGKAPVVTSFNR